jgi:hypothetical protein
MMGQSVQATCPCGYDSGLLMIGGGMHNFETLWCFPAYCAEGDHLVVVNLFDKPLRCEDDHPGKPVRYDDASLVGERGARVVSRWDVGRRKSVLTDGTYRCPSCHQFTLRFADDGLRWD